ncbi:hypothetical protein PMIN07_001653 [Paraphaeosphaeria minitans]|uniref:Uncharacterized protein n=1 Tax=Paraphaeosphaeria minitans TaxID=565426 RepID=A0A9P6GP77_9PLEO|nr:hypothetical protein PMIN01_03288 [Paraphaeosphaeria minitans]
MHTRGIYAPYGSWQGPDRHSQHHITTARAQAAISDQRWRLGSLPHRIPAHVPFASQTLHPSTVLHRTHPSNIPLPGDIPLLDLAGVHDCREHQAQRYLARAGWHERRHAGEKRARAVAPSGTSLDAYHTAACCTFLHHDSWRQSGERARLLSLYSITIMHRSDSFVKCLPPWLRGTRCRESLANLVVHRRKDTDQPPVPRSSLHNLESAIRPAHTVATQPPCATMEDHEGRNMCKTETSRAVGSRQRQKHDTYSSIQVVLSKDSSPTPMQFVLSNESSPTPMYNSAFPLKDSWPDASDLAIPKKRMITSW